MIERDRPRLLAQSVLRENWLLSALQPRPSIAKPDSGKKPQGSGLRAPVVCGNSDENVVHFGLGVFDEHVEVAVLFKSSAVEQFIFRILFRSATVLLNKLPIR